MRWLVSALFLMSVLGAPEGGPALGAGADADAVAAVSAPDTDERAPAEPTDEEPAPDAVASSAAIYHGLPGRAAGLRSRAQHPDSVIGLVPLPPPIA